MKNPYSSHNLYLSVLQVSLLFLLVVKYSQLIVVILNLNNISVSHV